MCVCVSVYLYASSSYTRSESSLIKRLSDETGSLDRSSLSLSRGTLTGFFVPSLRVVLRSIYTVRLSTFKERERRG